MTEKRHPRIVAVCTREEGRASVCLEEISYLEKVLSNNSWAERARESSLQAHKERATRENVM